MAIDDMMWNRRFREMIAYKNKHGHLNVSDLRMQRSLSRLKTWVLQQRKECMTMPEHRKEKLNSVGFEWVTALQEERWTAKLDALKDHLKRNGNRFPPKRSELGGWIARQRRLLKIGVLLPHRSEILNNMGFVWSCRVSIDDGLTFFERAKPHPATAVSLVDKWNLKYEELIKFKNEVGYSFLSSHASIPLLNWVYRQRRLYAKGILPTDRRQKLDDVGMPWKSDSSGENVLKSTARRMKNSQAPIVKKPQNVTGKKANIRVYGEESVQDDVFATSKLILRADGKEKNLRRYSSCSEPEIDDTFVEQANNAVAILPVTAQHLINCIYPVGTELLRFCPDLGWHTGTIKSINKFKYVLGFGHDALEELSINDPNIHVLVEVARSHPHIGRSAPSEVPTSSKNASPPHHRLQDCSVKAGNSVASLKAKCDDLENLVERYIRELEVVRERLKNAEGRRKRMRGESINAHSLGRRKRECGDDSAFTCRRKGPSQVTEDEKMNNKR